jgi:hypothetical protein
MGCCKDNAIGRPSFPANDNYDHFPVIEQSRARSGVGPVRDFSRLLDQYRYPQLAS